MATERGTDTRLYIKSGGAAFVKVGGETKFTFKRSRPEEDTSDKDGGKSQYGQAKISISISGNTKLPDAGLTALEAASHDGAEPVEIQLKHGDTIRFHCLVSIGNYQGDYPIGTATWQADMTNADTPIVDNLLSTAAAGA